MSLKLLHRVLCDLYDLLAFSRAIATNPNPDHSLTGA